MLDWASRPNAAIEGSYIGLSTDALVFLGDRVGDAGVWEGNIWGVRFHLTLLEREWKLLGERNAAQTGLLIDLVQPNRQEVSFHWPRFNPWS
jgi:hypothetical protein